jgi:hypothetical protein
MSAEPIANLPDAPFHGAQVWLVTVDMGYGHQRAAYPLSRIARGGVINANHYPGMPESDQKIFRDLEGFYNNISRFKKVPVLGPLAFRLYDHFQAIPELRPGKDLSRPSAQVRVATNLIRRRSWGRHLIDSLWREAQLPYLTTFFSTAHMADLHGYPGEIFCVICDADMSRDWVAKDPKNSRIFYFAPTPRVCERLRAYGVPGERMLLTGFPLPEENLGYPSFDILRSDTAVRIANLDPEGRFLQAEGQEVRRALAPAALPEPGSRARGRPLSIMFAVGGAGAQAEIGLQAASALAERIGAGQLRLRLIAGVSAAVRQIFEAGLRERGLQGLVGRGLEILFEPDKQKYFQSFNRTLRETDILWTKPSELCFYVGLGLPMLIAPTIGAHEEFNRQWLLALEAAVDQGDMKGFDHWFFEALRSGAFARAAFNGYSRAPREGTYNIIRHLAGRAAARPRA